MVANRKVTGKAIPLPAGVGMGVLISMGITLLLCAGTAWLVLTQRMGEGSLGYCVIAILLLATLAGSGAGAFAVKRQRMIVCVAVGAGYFGMLLMCTALFFGGQYEGIGVTALVILSGCLAAGLLGVKGGKRRKNKKWKPRFR